MFDNTLQNFFGNQSYVEIFRTSFGTALFIIILISLLVHLTINYAEKCYRWVATILDIQNDFIEYLLKSLRKLAINNIFDFLLERLELYRHLRQVKRIGYGEGIPLFFSVLIIFLYPTDLLSDEWVSITVFTILVIEKLWTITHLAIAVHRAKQLETAGATCYQEKRFNDSLHFYRQALSVYSQPRIASNKTLDQERAELLEQIAVTLNNQRRPEEALIHYRRALTLYNQDTLAKDQTLDRTRVRLLHQIAKLFYRLGNRQEAQKCCRLIYEQTGKRYVLSGSFY